MKTPEGLEQCLTFINCQLRPAGTPVSFAQGPSPKCAITLSRQSGCGAHSVAEKLARQLQQENDPSAPPWTVFDRNLMEKVLADHHLPERLARFMPEDRVRQIDDIMNELFGLHPPSWTVVQQTSETLLNLAELGNVILVGRGANVVTARLPHLLHIRLIGSLEQRVERMQRFEGLSARAATERIREEDLGRARYLKQHFGKDADDPLLYHIMINTDLILQDEAVGLILDLVRKREGFAVRR